VSGLVLRRYFAVVLLIAVQQVLLADSASTASSALTFPMARPSQQLQVEVGSLRLFEFRLSPPAAGGSVGVSGSARRRAYSTTVLPISIGIDIN
jgi:hypothetical protein